MRRLLITLVVLAVLGAAAVVADQRLHSLTEQRVAEQIRLSQDLDRPPDVEIGDSPFLPAAVRGRFERVTVRSETFGLGAVGLDTIQGSQAAVGDVQLRDVVATMTDVETPVREMLAGSTPPIRAGRLRVEATMDFPTLSTLVAAQADRLAAQVGAQVRDLFVTGAPDGVLLVSGTFQVAGLSLDLDLPVRVSVAGRDLVFEVAGGGQGLPAAAAELINGRVAVPPLPYGLSVDQVQPDADGLTLVASGENVLIDG
jgi:hypothetical protein